MTVTAQIGKSGLVVDAPSFRVWPPVALGAPLLIGMLLTKAVGDPFQLAAVAARVTGLVLLLLFGLWNGWCIWLMNRHSTALLPGGATTRILDRGPFAVSRNPLYVGLTVGYIGLALLWSSAWALVLSPIGLALIWWGAVTPEEHYLASKFGSEYEAYCRRVRRWL